MLNNLRCFLEYRKLNKVFSKKLKIKRDRKIDIFLLFGMWKSNRLTRLLKRNCRCYLDYYKERELELDFKSLNYIAARIATIYYILDDKEVLEEEFDNFDNYFYQTYVKNKTIELIKESDTKRKNLIVEAVV